CELDFGRLLHWQIRWFFAPQNTIDVGRRVSEQVRGVNSIGDKTAIGYKRAPTIHYGQTVGGGQSDDQFANRPSFQDCISGNDQAASRTLCQCLEDGLDFANLTDWSSNRRDPQRRRQFV